MSDSLREAPEPCPLCGNRAFVVAGDGSSFKGYEIWCRTDRCIKLPPRETEGGAIADWNRRAALRASTDAAPVAWMLRAERASHTRSARQYGDRRVLCGQVFMSDGTARAAAKRQTNRWRKIEAFPVYDHGAPAHSPAAAQAKLPGDGTISDQAILDHRPKGPYFQYRQTPSWAGSCTCGETFFADSSREVARNWATHVSEALSALSKEPKQ